MPANEERQQYPAWQEDTPPIVLELERILNGLAPPERQQAITEIMALIVARMPRLLPRRG